MPLKISKQSKGGYRCTADNNIGNPASADVFITVQCECPVIESLARELTNRQSKARMRGGKLIRWEIKVKERGSKLLAVQKVLRLF